MKWQWKLGRFAGIDVFVHATFILLIGFTLFQLFAALHSQWMRLPDATLKELAGQMNLDLQEDLPWDQWFNSS